MANFWTTSDNNAITTTGEFTSGGGTIENIPDNTTCLAMIDEAGLAEYQGDEYISLRWVIAEPAIYKGRKVFQKVRVFDVDTKKADKAKKMLMAIDANCGGKLALNDETPNDTAMAKALLHKPMLIKVMIWEMNDRTGNWVASVAPRSKTTAVQTPEPVVVDEGLHADVPW
jgi:hypothetical protein